MRLCVEILRVTGDSAGHLVDCLLQCAGSNRVRVIDLVDGGEDYGFQLLSRLPVSLETRAMFWHKAKAKLGRRSPSASPYKQASTNFGRIVESVVIQAGRAGVDFRPFTFHHLRHRHAVDWLKSGQSIYVLQKRMGHTSIKTTEMYLEYLTPEEQQKVMLGKTA
jgi:integrase/recombinase XerD